MLNLDDMKEDQEFWQISSNKPKRSNIMLSFDENPCLEESPSAGPFLTILLNKLRNFMSNSIYVNLHLTGLISRLAVYPQTLLRAYLLDHSLVLQPNIPSIFEVSTLFCVVYYCTINYLFVSDNWYNKARH